MLVVWCLGVLGNSGWYAGLKEVLKEVLSDPGLPKGLN